MTPVEIEMIGSTRKMPSVSNEQRRICRKFAASCLLSGDHLKIGISRAFDPAQFPLNGLRHPPQGDTSGWYVWSGEELSADPGFFVPLHAHYMIDRCPEIVRYFGLGPGWRFLLAPGQEDVWFDPSLLIV
jgi:hypothetical protein